MPKKKFISKFKKKVHKKTKIKKKIKPIRKKIEEKELIFKTRPEWGRKLVGEAKSQRDCTS